MLTHRPTPFRETTKGQAIAGSTGAVLIGGLGWLAGPAPVLVFLSLAFLSKSFLILSFVCLSYFRIHEAYPFLIPLKLPFVFSVASFAVIAYGIATHMLQNAQSKSAWFAVALLATGGTASLLFVPEVQTQSAAIAIAMIFAAIAFVAWFNTIQAMEAARWGIEMRLFIAFFAVATLGVPFAAIQPLAMEAWVTNYWKIGAMTLALAWLIRTRADFLTALWMLIASGALIALRTIYNWYHQIDLVEGTRVTIGRTLFSTAEDIANAMPGEAIAGGSLLGDPNDLALVLLYPVGLALAVVLRMGWRSPLGILCLITLPLLVTAIIMTQSRGGALGVIAVVGTIGFFLIRSKVILIAGCAIAAIGLIVAMDIEGRRSGGAAELEATGGLDNSAQERLYAWQAALNMTAARPLRGVGIKNFPSQFRAYTPVWPGRRMAVHSTWFGVMAETGLPGIALFLAMIAALALSLRRALQQLDALQADPVSRAFALGLIAGLAGFCVSGTFLTQGFTWPVYLQLGFTAALTGYVAQLAKQRSADQQTAAPAEPSRIPFNAFRPAT